MNFEELIETLSNGSAIAVKTWESPGEELIAPKEYLYVQTPVEKALRAEIDRNVKTPRVIFVCGYSGDGKSELFRPVFFNDSNQVGCRFDLTSLTPAGFHPGLIFAKLLAT